MQDIMPFVLNNVNKPITYDFINNIFAKYEVNHEVKDITLFQRAMVHTSYKKRSMYMEKTEKMIKEYKQTADPAKAMPLQDNSYQRMEFLGDSVAHLAIANYLYLRYPKENEGFMTKLRTRMENGETFAKISLKIGLNEYAVIANNIEQSGGRYNNISILEDIFEAFIGALFLETNYQTCEKFIINIIEKEIDISALIFYEKNYKGTLMQHFHNMKWKDPVYDIASSQEVISDGHATSRHFVVIVKRKNSKEIYGKGEGSTKKSAEKNAAKDALKNLGVLEKNDDSDYDFFGEI